MICVVTWRRLRGTEPPGVGAELSSWWTMRGGTFWWVQKLDLDLVQVPGTRDAPLELKTFVAYDCGVDVSLTLLSFHSRGVHVQITITSSKTAILDNSRSICIRRKIK